MKNFTSSKTLLERAVKYLSQREHSRLELRKKLTKFLTEEQTQEDIDNVLDRLAEKGLQSEERYAQSFVRMHQEKYGQTKLIFSLKQQGIPSDLIEKALDECPMNEEQRARRIWEKRYNVFPQTYTEQAKQIRFLMNRGFNLSVAKKVVPYVKEREE